MAIEDIIAKAMLKDARILQTNAAWRAEFYSRVRRTRGCHLWQSHQDSKGYGVFHHGNMSVRAHRVALLLDGQVSTELLWVACHLNICKNKHCVNPAHLYWGTPASNVADALPSLALRTAEKIAAMPMRRLIDDETIIKAWKMYYDDNMSARDVGAAIGITGEYVNLIVKRKFRAALTAALPTHGKRRHKREYGSISGDKQHRAKLTAESVQNLRRDICAGIPRKKLVDKYGVTGPNISQIAVGTAWSHLPWPEGCTPNKSRGSNIDAQTQGAIKSLYTQGTLNIRELAERYGKSINAIRRVIREGKK